MTQQVKSTNDSPLTKLRDSDLEFEDGRQDIRGRAVIDQNGKTIGHVRALFIDASERKVRMLDIGSGGLMGMGDTHFLLPVDAITKVSEKDVHVNESAERVKHSPAYDPDLEVKYDWDYWRPYYNYYGSAPYWESDYRYPNYNSWFY
jgi:sporulation protein YlmC with PRC-barrel domain